MAVALTSCGVLSSFADFDQQHSSLAVDKAVVPADGNTPVRVALELRYSATVPATNVPVAIEAVGVAVSIAPASGVTDANGMFFTTMTGHTPGTAHLTASVRGAQGSQTLQQAVQVVSVATGALLIFTSAVTQGDPATATLIILDDTQQRVAYYEGIVSFTSSDPAAILPTAYRFSAADQGLHTFPGATFNTPGFHSLEVNDIINPNISATVDAISVNVKSTPVLDISGISDALAGTVNQMRVRVRVIDAQQHVLDNYAGTVHFTSTDPNAVLPPDTAFTQADAGVKVLPLTLKTAGMRSVSAIDVANLSIGGEQSGIAVWVAAERYTVSVADPLPVAGTPLRVSVVAPDAYNNRDFNALGSIALTSQDPLAQLPRVYALTPADAGAHDFNITLYTSGAQPITAQNANGSLVGMTRVAVQGANATRLVLTGPPSAVAGTPATFVATAYDAYNNVAQSYIAQLAVRSSDANAETIGPIALLTGNHGSAIITPVVLTTAGAQVVGVTDANLALSANAALTVVNAPASTLSLAGLTSGPAGRSQSVTVSAFDSYGNAATDYTGRVSLASDDPQATLSPSTQFTRIDAGSRVLLPVIFKSAGVWTLTAADTANPNLRGMDLNIAITPLAAAALRVTTSGAAVVGAAKSILVQAVDIYGNIDTSFTGAAVLSSSDGNAVLPGAYTFAPSDQGQVILSTTFYTAGPQTLLANGSNLSSAPTPVTVISSGPVRLELSGLTDGRAGRAQTLVIQAPDNFDNLVTGYVGTLAVTSSDANATLPGPVTLTASDGGQKIVSSNDPNATLPGPITFAAGNAGSQTVTGIVLRSATSTASLVATDANAPTFMGTQGNITVAPGAVATTLTLTGLTSGAAGHSDSVTVVALDAYGNQVPQYRGSVAFSSSDGAAQVPRPYNFIGADRGAHTFTGVSLTSIGNQTMTVTDGSSSASQMVNIAPGAATFLQLSTNSSSIAGAAQNHPGRDRPLRQHGYQLCRDGGRDEFRPPGPNAGCIHLRGVGRRTPDAAR